MIKFFVCIVILFTTISITFADSFGLISVLDGLKGVSFNQADGIEKNILDIVGYLLTYLYIIAFMWIIWSGFQIMTAVGDEEKVKTGKKRIIYVLIGLVVIFLAYQIVDFVITGAESAK